MLDEAFLMNTRKIQFFKDLKLFFYKDLEKKKHGKKGATIQQSKHEMSITIYFQGLGNLLKCLKACNVIITGDATTMP